jgi:AbrB family looped-hinge helix DNA binding protein
MTTTVLSSKGQVIIPKPVRTAHHWVSGERLIVVDTAEGVLLKPFSRLKSTRLADVAGCLKYSGPAKSVEEMNEGLLRSVKAEFR